MKKNSKLTIEVTPQEKAVLEFIRQSGSYLVSAAIHDVCIKGMWWSEEKEMGTDQNGLISFYTAYELAGIIWPLPKIGVPIEESKASCLKKH